MAFTVSIHSAQIMIARADGNTYNVSLSPGVTTQADCTVFYSAHCANSNNAEDRHRFTARLTSTTNLQFTRFTNSFANDVIIEYYVIEWDTSQMNDVQTAEVLCTADPTNETISPTVNQDYTVVFADWETDITTIDDTNQPHVSLTSGSNLRFDFSAAPGTDDCTAHYHLVEFKSTSDAEVQYGDVTIGATAESATDTLTSVDEASTALMCPGLDGGTQNVHNRRGTRLVLTNDTTVTADRSTDGTTYQHVVPYYSLELTGSEDVESGTGVLSGATATSASFPELGADHAVMTGSPHFGTVRAPNSGSFNRKATHMYISIQVAATPTTVTVERGNGPGGYDMDYSWFVADFTAAADLFVPFQQTHVIGAKPTVIASGSSPGVDPNG